jgi:hypothetical protein
LVVRYFGLVGAHMPLVYPWSGSASAGTDLCNKASTDTAEFLIAPSVPFLPVNHFRGSKKSSFSR